MRQKILENKNPMELLSRMVQVLRRKQFYPNRITHPWGLVNTFGISVPSHAAFWLQIKVLAPVTLGMDIPHTSS